MDNRDAYFRYHANQVMAKYLQEGKEDEVNMKDMLIKLFGGHNPLDCIQDLVLQQCSGCPDIVEVTMSVPSWPACDAHFIKSTSKKHTVGGRSIPQLPKRIIFSGPKTIVFWHDDTKTIVSCAEDEEYDPYNAFCAAVVKKMFGTTSAAKSFLHKHSEYHAPKEKKSKPEEFEGVEYQVNCDVDIMEAEIVPVYEEECRSSPIEYDNCVGDYSKEDC